MSQLSCNLEGFKKSVAEFAKSAPTANSESLENGLKCVNLLYLTITPAPAKDSLEQITAISTWKFARDQYFKRTRELMKNKL